MHARPPLDGDEVLLEPVNIDTSSFLEYEPLCKERRVRVELRNLERGVDYYPAQYDEVYCESDGDDGVVTSDKCAHPGFKCVQQYTTLFVIRRDIKKDCYLQKATLKVPSGCECMWPARQLGGASDHY
ncbi:hypothetical protein R5R35_011629 [Gryllus longicercus]|uniref:Spaetzle domain-containing protein n=1 Tax=Gryllus longicercus TaxID=2509291 RepID=A0AAN9VNS9_9ORTH